MRINTREVERRAAAIVLGAHLRLDDLMRETRIELRALSAEIGGKSRTRSLGQLRRYAKRD